MHDKVIVYRRAALQRSAEVPAKGERWQPAATAANGTLEQAHPRTS